MSRLFDAMEKQKKALVAARSLGDSDAIGTPAEPQAKVGTEARTEMLRLPPLLIDYSKEFAQEIALLYRSLAVVNQGLPSIILICSPESGAGTTTVALNLASYFVTNEGGKALFIEANFQNSYLARCPGGKRVGFSDLLAEQGSIINYASQTSTPGLYVMSAGRASDASNKFVTQSRVGYILEDTKREYPFIIFDGAPITASDTTLELAKVVDGVIMVARANALADVVGRAKAALESEKANILGLVYSDY